jgi:hypothetical protein
MYKWVFKNRWAALLFVGMLGLTVYFLVGGEEEDGQLLLTAAQIVRTSELTAQDENDFSEPTDFSGILQDIERAEEISDQGRTDDDLTSFYDDESFDEEDLIDTAMGVDPVPEIDGSPMIDPNTPDNDVGGWGVELPPEEDDRAARRNRNRG